VGCPFFSRLGQSSTPRLGRPSQANALQAGDPLPSPAGPARPGRELQAATLDVPGSLPRPELAQAGFPRQAGIRNLAGLPLPTISAGLGWDSLAQAGLSLPCPDFSFPGWLSPPVGRDSPYPGHILHSASTPARCASLGTPFGSD
jgi:hypothetical protein